MKIPSSAIVLVFLIGMLTASMSAQAHPGILPGNDELPNPREAVDCGLALRYIDNALAKAADNGTVIFIIRINESDQIKIARKRSANIRNYARFRRFVRLEVTVDLDPIQTERIDVYVMGERLYSLPIKRGDTLNFARC